MDTMYDANGISTCYSNWYTKKNYSDGRSKMKIKGRYFVNQ